VAEVVEVVGATEVAPERFGSLRASLAVYRRLVGARIRADWQYRTSFFLFLAGQTAVALADFGVIAAIFTNVHVLAGWSGPEVALLFGLSGVSFGLGDLLVSPVETASTHIKTGSFDQFLIRPVGVLWQLCATEFAARRLGRTLQPAIVLVISLTLVDIEHPWLAIVAVPVTVVSGTVIFSAIWVVTSSVAFWTVETQEFANAFTYGGGLMTSYPVDVFGQWLRRAVIFVVPLASVAYMPAAGMLGKSLPFGLPDWVAWTGPLVALATALIARGVWGTALRHHRSTGS
jgi:ABC-2 type transport system permease protein